MGGLVQSVGNGISGLVSGAIAAVMTVLGGMIRALDSALPAGALPVLCIAALLVLAWFLFRR